MGEGVLRMRNSLHLAAALCLVFFACLHILVLARGNPLLQYYSPVFSLIRMKTLFTLAVAQELVIAAMCIKYRGEDMADYSVFYFILTMLGYKLGLALTSDGVVGCGCLGYLTDILDLKPYKERVFSFLALFVMGFCTAPGVLARLKKRDRGIPSIVLLALMFLPANLKGQNIEIYGNYNYTNYEPKTGLPIRDNKGTHYDGRFLFGAIINPVSWKISVTNVEDPLLWSEVAYDGTNSFTIAPYRAPFLGNIESRQNTILVTISPTPYYLTWVSDWTCSFIPWLTFGLDPEIAKPDASGFLAIPLPWQASRRKLRAYGWDWKITPSINKRFVSECRVVREPRLDRDELQELLRPEFDYPDTVDDKNLDVSSLQYRKGIATGFVDTDYRCTKWLDTNNFILPLESTISQYLLAPHVKSPWLRGILRVESISFVSDASDLLAEELQTVRVLHDFRYRASNKSRIYKSADYTLQPGEFWKGPSDRVLVAERAEYLSHGPKYDHFDYDSKHVAIWVFGGIMFCAPPILVLVQKLRRKT